MKYYKYIFIGISSEGVIGSSFSSSVTRLRGLFDTVRSFAGDNESQSVPSTEVTRSIVDSAVSFARNEGRELDNFVNVLQKVAENGYGTTGLDSLVWQSLDQLYKIPEEAGEEGQNPVETIPAIETLNTMVEEILPMNKQKLIKKRVIAESRTEDNRVDKKPRSGDQTDKISLIMIRLKYHFDHPSTTGLSGHGYMYLRYKYYEMALNGDYDSMLEDIRILELSRSFHVSRLFAEAHKVLLDPSYRIKGDELSNYLISKNHTELRKSRPLTRGALIERMAKYCSTDISAPFGKIQTLSETIFDFAKMGDLKSVAEYFDLLDFGFTSRPKMGAIFIKTYNLLKQREIAEMRSLAFV